MDGGRATGRCRWLFGCNAMAVQVAKREFLRLFRGRAVNGLAERGWLQIPSCSGTRSEKGGQGQVIEG